MFCLLTLCADKGACVFGTCELTGTSGRRCRCQPGYEGARCERRRGACADNPCEGRGICQERRGEDGSAAPGGGLGFHCR